MATIEITIPNDKLAEFKVGFLKSKPIPLDENQVPIYTESQWIERIIVNHLKAVYRNGKTKLAKEAAIIDDDVLI